jgi:uncharacterized protein YqcC (DUF446 family)
MILFTSAVNVFMVKTMEVVNFIQDYFRETITNFLADRTPIWTPKSFSLTPYSETKPAVQVAPFIVPVFEFELLS